MTTDAGTTTTDEEDTSPPEECPDMSECGQLYVQEAACRLAAAAECESGASRGRGLSGEEAYLKMMMAAMRPDSPPGEESHRRQMTSPRRSIYRTLSDESVCSSSNRQGSSYAGSSHSSLLDQALPNHILFSSTPAYHCTLPPRITLSQGGSNLRNELWFSDGWLAERPRPGTPGDPVAPGDPGLMPFPDSAADLDWPHLVDAARAFQDQRVASFCSMTDMQRAEALHISQELTRRMAAAEGACPATLTGKVNQLEVILRQLQHDLRKEKEDKAVLQVEVQHLRQDNMRLQEESQTAAAQLRKFTEWFFHSIDKKP